MSQEPSQHRDEPSDDGPLSISDDQLPGDLQPSEDNPLARPANDDVPDDLLLQEAAHAHSGGDSEDAATGDDDASGTSSSTASSETGSTDADDDPDDPDASPA